MSQKKLDHSSWARKMRMTNLLLTINGVLLMKRENMFVLVSPCFKENVVVTCKSGSFLCSLDNLLQKNVIVFFFWKSNFKMALIWKKGYFWSTFHIFSHQGKVKKIPSANMSLIYVHVFCSPYLLFFFLFFLPHQFWKKKYEFMWYGFSLVWVLVLILIRAILEQSINNKMVSKI